MDKTPPRAGHPLDGAASRKVTRGCYWMSMEGRSPRTCHKSTEARSCQPSSPSLGAFIQAIGTPGQQNLLLIPTLRSPLELVLGGFYTAGIATRDQRQS